MQYTHWFLATWQLVFKTRHTVFLVNSHRLVIAAKWVFFKDSLSEMEERHLTV